MFSESASQKMEDREGKDAKDFEQDVWTVDEPPTVFPVFSILYIPLRVLPVFSTLDIQLRDVEQDLWTLDELPRDSICSFKRELPALREVHNSFVTVLGKRISGAYDGRSQRTTWGTYLEMEHSAANAKKSEWNLIVKCRKKVRAIQETFSISHWANITEVFPDAEVKMLGKKVHLNLTEAMKNYEFAVFGKPGKNDRKRMQLGIFGSKPEKAQDWKIYVTLFDDTLMAFKHARDVEKGRGRRLLTTLAGLFVSNSDEDIKIDLSMLAVGWQIKGNKIQVIKSEDAWNYLENSTDFPRCCFVISHEDMRKKSFYCEIAASHGNDTAETALVEHFEEGSNSGGNSTEFRAWNVAIPHLRGRIVALGRG